MQIYMHLLCIITALFTESFVHNHCTIYRIFCDQKKPSLSSYEGQENSLEEKIKPFRFLRRVSRL